MFLDAAAAKALFAIVIATTQGADVLKPQFPLRATDRGDAWLVTGTPHTDNKMRVRFSMYIMFFNKRTAEVLGVEHVGRIIPTEDEKAYWATIMTPEQYANLSRPPSHFEAKGIHEVWYALYGGVLTTAAAAVDYAVVLMRTKPAWAHVEPSDLMATERDNVWHITGRHAGTGDLVTISKATGKLLSGNL